MSLQRFLKKVGTVSPLATVREAAAVMRDRGIGAVVVVSDDGELIGIFTDRDVALRVVAEGKPSSTAVGDVMTSRPVFVLESTSIEQACLTMAERGVRRLPIVDRDHRVIGLLALDDIFLMLGMELGEAARAIFLGVQAETGEEHPL